MIRSAVLRFPSRISVLMNLVTSALLYSGSSGTSRFGTSRLRGIFYSREGPVSGQGAFVRLTTPGFCLCLRLRPLGAVLRPALLAALHTHRVQRAADDVVADSGQVLDAAAADEHERVLLEVMADAGDIGGDLDTVREADTRHLAKRRVRLLRRLREHPDAHAALLRAVLQRR